MALYNTNISQNFLNKYSKIPPQSQEWNKLEYSLQLSLGTTTSVVKNIWSIANPHMAQNFEKKTKDLLTLDCWIDCNSYDDNNGLKIERICSKGFDFAGKGLIFQTGHLQINNGKIEKNRPYDILFLKIAVGRSYCLPSNIQIKDTFKPPLGFDSIYFYNEDDESNSCVFSHKYMLFDSNLVLPMNVVRFEIDQSKEDALAPPICENCSDNEARVYCKADDASLCNSCADEHKQKLGRLQKKHEMVDLKEKPKTFGYCKTHADSKLDLYCTICHEPLCVNCKIIGTHSQGEMALHQLYRIIDTYNKALSESRELNPQLEKKKNQLADNLNQIDQRIKDINKNASYVETQIYNTLQKALQQLQQETQQKMSFLIADQLELKRQYDQIQWLESFLKYQQDVLPPQDYLNSWSRHCLIRQDIVNISSNIPVMTNVNGDLKLEGAISVVSSQNVRVDDDQYNSIQINNDIRNRSNYNQAQQDDQFDSLKQNLNASQRFKSDIFKKHDRNSKLLQSLQNNTLPQSQMTTNYQQGVQQFQYNDSEQKPNQINLMTQGNQQGNRSPTKSQKSQFQTPINENDQEQ